MKTLGVMALGVVLFLAFSRLSTDAIGIFMGLVAGLAVGSFVIVGVIIGHGLRQDRRYRDRIAERQQPPVIVVQQPVGYLGRGYPTELPPQPQPGGFRLVERHDQGDEWR